MDETTMKYLADSLKTEHALKVKLLEVQQDRKEFILDHVEDLVRAGVVHISLTPEFRRNLTNE